MACVASICGCVRISYAQSEYEESVARYESLENIKDTTVTEVVSDMQIKDTNLVLTCSTLLVYVPIKDSIGTYGNERKAIISEDEMPRIGDTVSITGKISPMKPATNPGQFDAKAYYRSQSITHSMYATAISIDRSGSSPMNILFDFGRRACEIIDEICEPDDAGFFKAALIGDKTGLSDDMYDLYRRNGIAHLLAISGLHIAILGLSLYKILRSRRISYITAGVISAVLLCIYALLTGASPSIVRAVSMLILTFVASSMGRTYDLVSSVCAAAIGILLVSPFEVFNSGFQLSFLAVVAIGIPHNMLCKRYVLVKKSGILGSISVSLCVTIITLPVICYSFYGTPSLSFILNLIVIPLMTYVLISGIGVIVLGSVSQVLGYMAAGSGHYILKLYVILCDIMESLPHAYIMTGRPRLDSIVSYYILIFIFFKVLTSVTLKKYARVVLSPIIMCLAIFILLPGKDSDAKIYFLDVGQGDSICILEGDVCTLVDCGSSSSSTVGANIVEPFLKSMAVTRIDRIFVTHADGDHTNGIKYILGESTEFDIGIVYLPRTTADSSKYDEIRKLCDERQVPIIYIDADGVESPTQTDESTEDLLGTDVLSYGIETKYELGDIQVLSPSSDVQSDDTNDDSLVLLYTRGEYSMLLCGDASQAMEEDVLARLSSIEVTDSNLLKEDTTYGIMVVKAGHHGSKTSSGRGFMSALSPYASILSYGATNRYGHPHEETLDTLRSVNSHIYETARDGCIIVRTDGENMSIETFVN